MNATTGRWLQPLSDAVRAHDPTGKMAERIFDAAMMPGAESGKALNDYGPYALEVPGAATISWSEF